MFGNYQSKFDRRLFLTGAAISLASVGAASGAAAAAPELSSEDRVKAAAEELSAAMTALHGGTWRTLIDHGAQLAAVSRDFSDDRTKVALFKNYSDGREAKVDLCVVRHQKGDRDNYPAGKPAGKGVGASS
ncbi:hypothetical protein FJ970_22535 [Mesorhizobium sp. B2-1-8]|uniref:hypothetical protein n=1 Tax=Mesorhizobium sp. B2-1-8 TaxID=2589967 RepID=UPI00112E5B97|nr:hypothetical protein [Mesorhizobium sp. B2-1-8]UCI17863.1 hypothetical protein FJ970_22535 [Mesorhizobium sp. B2-1-8]